MLTIENLRHTIEIVSNGQPLMRYRVETPASKPHFDRLALPPDVGDAGDVAGRNIVLAAPHDHVWHFGLFFAQKFVNRLNFWESECLADRGEPYGQCRDAGELTTAVHDSGAVGFGHEVHWRTNTDETWIRERRELVVQPPSAGSCRLDWTMVWTAQGRDIELTSESDDPEHGDYSGLSYRCLRSMNQGTVLNSEGADTIESVLGRRARWADYSGKLDGKLSSHDPDWAGVTIMDHPSNHDHPVKWFCQSQPFGFLSANRTFGGSWTLERDKPVTTRFAILVHAGLPDRERIEQAYHWFARVIG